MNKFWLIVNHTYKKNVNSKAFWISTFISCLVIAILFNLGNEAQNKISTVDIGVISSEEEYELLKEVSKENKKVKFTKYENEQVYKEHLKNKDKYNLLIIEKENNDYKFSFKTDNITDFSPSSNSEKFANEVKQILLAKENGIDKETIQEINKLIEIERFDINKTNNEEGNQTGILIIVFLCIMLIYASVVLYGNAVAIEVASEKSSRITEVLISSVNSKVNLFAKVLALALVNLTQYSFYFLVVLLNFNSFKNIIEGVPTKIYIFGAIFIVLGYLLYSSLLAMMGSLATKLDEVHQLVGPINIMVVIAFVISIFGFFDPEGISVTITSFIPFFAPLVMFLRVSLLDVPSIEIAISIILMVVTVIISIVVSSKVYEKGAINYENIKLFKLLKIIKKEKIKK